MDRRKREERKNVGREGIRKGSERERKGKKEKKRKIIQMSGPRKEVEKQI